MKKEICNNRSKRIWPQLSDVQLETLRRLQQTAPRRNKVNANLIKWIKSPTAKKAVSRLERGLTTPHQQETSNKQQATIKQQSSQQSSSIKHQASNNKFSVEDDDIFSSQHELFDKSKSHTTQEAKGKDGTYYFRS
jgi:hypothetical protein